jgi:hypothetical protein
MPYERAKRVLSNFMPSSMPGGFGTTLGVGQGYYSPELNWQNAPTMWTEAPGQTQPSQPPEGAPPAGRTGVEQGPAGPSSAPEGAGPSPSPSPVSFNREILRNNPYSGGVQQGGVRKPLSQARRYGL